MNWFRQNTFRSYWWTSNWASAGVLAVVADFIIFARRRMRR